MTITTQEALVPDPDPNQARAPQGSTWLELDGPTVRTVFVGHVAGSGAGAPARLTGARACRTYRRSLTRPRSSGAAVACADSGGPTMHGARLTRRGRALVAMAWLVLVVVAAAPIVNVIANGGLAGS